MPYFNYRLHPLAAEGASYWERRAFLHAWWSLYREDGRWTPPDYGQLRREFDLRRNEHLARLNATFIHVDALHRTGLQRSRTDQQDIPLVSVIERPLAAAVAVIDSRRKGRTAHLALPHFGRDKEAFDVLYYHLVESMAAEGYHRLVTPVGLSPHLGSGLLVDGWDEWPPSYTPSNPPYVPELVESRFNPLQDGRLYRAAIPARPPDARDGPARIQPFAPGRLAGDLLPLLAAAVENPTGGFPPPDVVEAAFLLRVLGAGKLTGCLAETDGTPVGFVLMGDDSGDWLRATRGGRSWWRRGWRVAETGIRGGSRSSQGRLFFGAVQPDWCNRGIGAQLWQEILARGAARGWATLTIGPVWRGRGERSPAESFLENRAAVPRQTYRLYERSF